MDFIFRFLRWKAANAAWNAGARAARRRRHPLPEERIQFIADFWAMVLTLVVTAGMAVLFAILG